MRKRIRSREFRFLVDVSEERTTIDGEFLMRLGLWTLIVAMVASSGSRAEALLITNQPIESLGDLARLEPAQLEALYVRSAPGAIPRGRVRGLALVRPGTKLGPVLSRGAGVAWQGKVFDQSGSSSINKFFGVRAVKANVAYGPSWRDGNPSIILDYSQTSKIYEPYRDELREVAPGIYLGLMFDRRTCPPSLKMYFAIQTLRD